MKNYEIIRRLKERDITVVEVAKKLDISRQAFYKKVNGIDRFSKIQKRQLARALRIRIVELDRILEA